MDKREFYAAVNDDLRKNGAAAISQSTVAKVLDSIVAVSSCELNKTGKVRIPGLVSFTLKHRSERIGRNPKTGHECPIPAGFAIKAKAVTSFVSDAI